MTAGSRPFGVGKRVLSGVAAGAIAVPISFGMMGTALAFNGNQNATPPAAIGTNTACPPSQVTNQGFTDISGAANQDQINCLGDYGITKGTTATTYSPTRGVARANMAAFIYRLGKLDTNLSWNTSPYGFKDISTQPQEFQDAINALANAGVVSGKDSTHFAPGALVTREQMSKFIALILAKITGSTSNPNQGKDYFDDDDQSIFEPYINAIAGLGVYVGDGVSKANPGNNTTRQQMAAFIARTLEIGVEQGKIPNHFNNTVALSATANPTSVNSGGSTTLTITGQNITGYTVTGPCTSGASASNITPPANGAKQTIPVQVAISSSAAAGTCTLTTTVTYSNGLTQQATTNLTVSQTATSLPQLVSAKIVSTTPVTSANASNPAGTTVQYTFSKPVATVSQTLFRVYPYNWDNTGPLQACTLSGGVPVQPSGNPALEACTTSIDSSGTVVTATYPTLDATTGTTADNVNNYTLATVAAGAGTTTTGTQNPPGAAAIGTQQSGGTTSATAGRTSAPDLVSIGNFRAALADTQTAVDFTFDQAAFDQVTTGFHLVLTDNTVLNCTGPTGTTPASGGTVAGGNGTTTFTVVCNNVSGGTTDTTASQVARGYVDAGTVGDAATPTVTNPLEAAHTGNGTIGPDLVSISVTPGATSSDSDTAVFTFDQTPGTAIATSFKLFHSDTTVTSGVTATPNPSNPNQIAVTFPNGTLTNATGGNVAAGAVGGAPPTGNQPDSQGFTPSSTSTSATITPGVINAPQLQSVGIKQKTDVFGNVSYYAAYTFNEAVNVTSASSGFRLYNAAGSQYTSETCTVNATTNTEVDCTFTGTPAGESNISAAKLGAVDLGAVTGNTGASTNKASNANRNPEGSKSTS